METPAQTPIALTPEAAVQGQLDAYNQRDLAGFLSFYAEDIRGYRLGDETPLFTGKAAMGAHYAAAFQQLDVRAALVNRIVVGNKVFDHERLTGAGRPSFDAVVIFQVHDGLIRTVWLADAT